MTKANPKYSLVAGADFQKMISTISPNSWFTGENILKKYPGFTVLKYSLAAAMELGDIASP